jgi:hypothetical protein
MCAAAAHRELCGLYVEELRGPLVCCSVADEVEGCEARLAPAGHKHQHRLGGGVHLRVCVLTREVHCTWLNPGCQGISRKEWEPDSMYGVRWGVGGPSTFSTRG